MLRLLKKLNNFFRSYLETRIIRSLAALLNYYLKFCSLHYQRKQYHNRLNLFLLRKSRRLCLLLMERKHQVWMATLLISLRRFWSIVGEDVTAAILFFFRTRDLHPGFNSTIVALVPKCQNPSRISEYRPISCCSVIYKCITKLLANRIKKFLLGIISNC